MSFKNIVSVTCTAFVFITLLSACSAGQRDELPDDPGNALMQQEDDVSNRKTTESPYNTMSGDDAFAAGRGNIIVYIWDKQLIRVNTDGSYRQVLLEDTIGRVCIYGDWIIYHKIAVATDPSRGIYRVRVDGSDNVQLTAQVATSLLVVDGWIYYIAYDAAHYMDWERALTIWRMRIDGTDRQQLYQGYYNCLSTDGRCLYFHDSTERRYLKAPLNGGEFSILVPAVKTNCRPQLADGWVYFVDGVDHSTYRIRTDGTDRMPFSYDDINVTGSGCDDFVYRSSVYYDNKIFGIASGESRELVPFLPRIIHVAGNHLLLENANGTALWLADLNGDNLILLERS